MCQFVSIDQTIRLFAILQGTLLAGMALAEEGQKKALLAGPNVFCGPQSVQRVLEHYGQRVSLSELVREIQWPDYQRGATLADLAKSMESRGLHTRAVEVPAGTDLDWKHPMILHVEEGEIQHYVVWLPPDSKHARPRIWDGSVRPSSRQAFRPTTILLTSDSPIPDSPVVGRVHQSLLLPTELALVIVCAAAAIAIGWILSRLSQSRSVSASVNT